MNVINILNDGGHYQKINIYIVLKVIIMTLI